MKRDRFCCACGKFKQNKFFIDEEHRYCKSCEGKKPELKKWRMVDGRVIKQS